MAATSCSSGNENKKRYHQSLEMEIGNLSVAKKLVGMDLRTSAFNGALQPYGVEMGNSRWIFRIARHDHSARRDLKYLAAFLALEGNDDIELRAEEVDFRIIGTQIQMTKPVMNLKGVDVTQRPLKATDFKCIGFIPLESTPGDCLRFCVNFFFTVVSGGTPPVNKMTFTVIEPGSVGLDGDECILKSYNGRCFRVKKQLLERIPYFDGILKAITDPKLGHSLNYDEETLEFVFESLKVKRVMGLEMNKKVLKAANEFGLKELQEEAMFRFVTDLTFEKAASSFKFASKNGITCLKDRIVTLIPDLLGTITAVNAAKALILSTEMRHPVLRKKAFDVIAGDLNEFVKAGGIEEIKSVTGLVEDVLKAVAEHSAAEKNGGSQNEAPAKKAKTTP